MMDKIQCNEIWISEILKVFQIPNDLAKDLETVLFFPDKNYPPIFLPIENVRGSFDMLKHYSDLWLKIDIDNIVLFSNLNLADDEIVKLSEFQEFGVIFDSINVIDDCLRRDVVDKIAASEVIVNRRKEKFSKFMKENWLYNNEKFSVWKLYMDLFNKIENFGDLNEYFERSEREILGGMKRFNLRLLYVKLVYWIEKFVDLNNYFNQLGWDILNEKENFDKWLLYVKLVYWDVESLDLLYKLEVLSCGCMVDDFEKLSDMDKDFLEQLIMLFWRFSDMFSVEDFRTFYDIRWKFSDYVFNILLNAAEKNDKWLLKKEINKVYEFYSSFKDDVKEKKLNVIWSREEKVFRENDENRYDVVARNVDQFSQILWDEYEDYEILVKFYENQFFGLGNS